MTPTAARAPERPADTDQLMEEVVERENLKAALHRVKVNTVYLTITMASAILSQDVPEPFRGRSGYLLILRLSPRGLHRDRLETTRSSKISLSTAAWNAGRS